MMQAIWRQFLFHLTPHWVRLLRAERLEERSRNLRHDAARLRATKNHYEIMFSRYLDADASELDDRAAFLRVGLRTQRARRVVGGR